MDFLLEPNVVFLNHGSFGACPREVVAEYQGLQRRLESQPVRFMQRELQGLLARARERLSEFVNARPDEVVFVPNPTFAVNEIAKSLRLSPEDEVLVSDQEYGACQNAWRFMSLQAGFQLVEQTITLPVASAASIVEEFWSGVTARTRVIFLSQITSPTALTLPVGEICKRARTRGILTVIDGAHAPGQIDVDLEAMSPDFYVATCHKWMCAPKGSAFFYARREMQPLIEPLIVGWGWGDQRTVHLGSDFLDHHEWLGTWDPSAYLTVPFAIEFQRRNDWTAVRQRCHELAVELVDRAAGLDGAARVHENEFFQQMALIELLRGGDARAIKTQLYDEFRIEVPVIQWRDRLFIRASLQAYNTPADVDAFVRALETIFSTGG